MAELKNRKNDNTEKNGRQGTGSAYTVSVCVFIILFWLLRLIADTGVAEGLSFQGIGKQVSDGLERISGLIRDEGIEIAEGGQDSGGDAEGVTIIYEEDDSNQDSGNTGTGEAADVPDSDDELTGSGEDEGARAADGEITGGGVDAGTAAAGDENVSGESGAADNNETEDPEKKVAEFVTVDDTYFDDALFIGDSRMMGVYDYCGWENATFLCDNGYSIYGFGEGKQVDCQNTGVKTKPETMLKENDFGKVYLMIGTNDCPFGDYNAFRKNYGYLVKLIKYTEPDAVIYLISNLRMSKSGVENNKGRGFDNERMDKLNEIIAQFADDERIFYLDINGLFTDEEGYLREEYTFDGFHLYAGEYIQIGDYLRSHAVRYDSPEENR